MTQQSAFILGYSCLHLIHESLGAGPQPPYATLDVGIKLDIIVENLISMGVF